MGKGGYLDVNSDNLPNIATMKDDLPSKKDIKAVIPKHCFERSNFRSLSLVLRDGLIIGALGTAAWFLPTEGLGPLDYLAWSVYWFFQGTAFTGWWVLAHECGHRGFSANNYVNDSVGYVLHSLLLVPYFSWQYSHAKHHAKTNHLLDGESHNPPSNTKGRFEKQFNSWLEFMGDDAFAFYQVISHLVFGWPMYLIMNATGARRTLSGKRIKTIHDHFRPDSKLFPEDGRWNARIAASTFGCLATLALLYIVGTEIGHTKVAMMYFPAYMWCNAWLVLYTWLQHTAVDLPQFGEDEWTWLRGALCTIDRPYTLFDNIHHHIGSTHVCHHLFSNLPCYHAQEATAALKAYLEPKGLYNFDGRDILTVTWEVSKECHYVEGIEGVQFFKSLTLEDVRKHKAARKADKKSKSS